MSIGDLIFLSIVTILAAFFGIFHSDNSNGPLSPIISDSTGSKSLPTVDEVVTNIRNNESFYTNIHFHYRCSMRLEKNSTFRQFPQVLDRFVQDIDFVRVNALFRTVKRRESVSVTDIPSHYEELSAYDGETIFRKFGNKSINIVLNAPVETDYYYPHAILGKEKFLMNHPLSDVITGGDSMKKYPETKHFDFSAKVVGFERIGDEPCLKVIVDIKNKYKSGKVDIEYRNIWLATEKNYLPVKIVAYDNNMGNLIVCEAEVERFVELDHGIWIPVKMTSKGYDETAFYQNKTYQLNDTYIAEITDASLNPKISPDTFHENRIPDGAKVHKVKNGHIIETYIKGITKTKPVKVDRARKSKTSIFMILFGFGVFLIIIVAIVRSVRFKRLAS